MGLESGNYISDLRKDWPLTEDFRREGDDHLRLIKKTLVQTFPNITGPVTLSQEEANGLLDYISQVEDELQTHMPPVGTVVMWAGAFVPAGWTLCNGSTFSGVTYPELEEALGGTTLPDLRDRFVVGSASSYSPGDTGGADSVSTGSGGDHTHGGATGSHAITAAELPAHSHFIAADQATSENPPVNPGASDYIVRGNDTGGGYGYGLHATGTAATVAKTSSVGSGTGHTHTVPSSGDHTHTVDNRPQFYALAFIIKLSAPTTIVPPS